MQSFNSLYLFAVIICRFNADNFSTFNSDIDFAFRVKFAIFNSLLLRLNSIAELTLKSVVNDIRYDSDFKWNKCLPLGMAPNKCKAMHDH